MLDNYKNITKFHKLAKLLLDEWTIIRAMDDKTKKELNILTLEFSEKLKKIIRPKDQSDRTTFRRIAEYLKTGIEENQYTTRIFWTVLEFAKEAAGPNSRNPAAVFMKILKEEIGYGKT